MYLRLQLKNWRSIDEAEIELAPFSVIVGKNSTGKSNVVDALLFASEVTRDASTAVSRRGGIVSLRRWSTSKPYDVLVSVTAASSPERLSTDFRRHEFVLKSGKDGAWRFSREEIEVRVSGRVELNCVREEKKLVESVGLRLARTERDIPETTSAVLLARQLADSQKARFGLRKLSLARSLRPLPEQMRQPQPATEAFRLVETAANITSALRRLDGRRRKELVAAMSRIVPGLSNVDAEEVGRYLSLVFSQDLGSDRHPRFAATEMSDGALRALAVVVAALQMGMEEILAIEEPEVNLHPGAASVVYDVLRRAAGRGLIVVTTHSPEFLDRAKDDEILVCEYLRGVTRIGPLASAQRELVRQGLFTTAELMRADELRAEGSVPRSVPENE